MLTKAAGEADQGDVEDYEGHQALVPQEPHGPPDGRWHCPHQGPQGSHHHVLSQLTLLLHYPFLHKSQKHNQK